MHTIQVYINNVVVCQQLCRPDESIMKAHQLKRIYLIDALKQNGIDCGCSVTYEDGRVFDAVRCKIVDDVLTIQSAMNDENFKYDA